MPDPLEQQYVERALRKQARTIRYISGTKPFTVRRRILDTMATPLHFNYNVQRDIDKLFVLDVSTLGSSDELG